MLDLEDFLNALAREYAHTKGINGIRLFDDLSYYHQAKVAVLVKNSGKYEEIFN